MKSNKLITFSIPEDIYDNYRKNVEENGERVETNILNYMMAVANYGVFNPLTLSAIEDVVYLKVDPQRKTYSSFDEILKEIEDEGI